MARQVCSRDLGDVLSPEQADRVVGLVLGADWRAGSGDVCPAARGMTGFLGQHLRAKLLATRGPHHALLTLFIKRVPLDNRPKADFIDQYGFYQRERLVFELLEETGAAYGPEPWCPTAYIYTDTLVVMPDLAERGYSTRPQLEALDEAHVRLAATALARFHAAIGDLETRRAFANARPYTLLHEYAPTLAEATFQDTPWLRTAAKLTADFLRAFSTKHRENGSGLDSSLAALYIKACDTMKEYEGTLNVLIHKDLWVNNIMFLHEDGRPTSALLLDFQCARYAPPAFDLMIFLYLNTTRHFREQYEASILRHYYSVFTEAVGDDTRRRLASLEYDYEEFAKWSERGRMFAVMEAATILPYVLMDPEKAQQNFDDPKTFEVYSNEDRAVPVLRHARESAQYKDRQLEVCEEFVERYVWRQL